MRRSMMTTLVTTAAALTIMSACASDSADEPTNSLVAPDVASFHAAPRKAPKDPAPTGPVRIKTVRRPAPLRHAITVSRTFGVKGGRIAIPGAGMTLTVPAGALTQATTITVTARAGSDYAYEFEPHGLVFAEPLRLHQNLLGARGYSNPHSLELGYFPDASDVTSVTELVPTYFDPGAKTVSAPIRHFSGYIFAGGRSDEM